MPNVASILSSRLSQRRHDLGMSIAAISSRSGVSVPTVRRLLEGRIGEASFANVAAVAEVLGAPLQLAERDTEEFRLSQARAKAEQVARLVQGTSGLEGQAVDTATYNRFIERSTRELLVGSNRKLWAK